MKHTEDFKREAVRIALSSGPSRTRIASDPGVGKSTLNKWIADYRPAELLSEPQGDPARENERLRQENRILREEREILKKLSGSSRVKNREVCFHSQASAWGAVERLCHVLQVLATWLPGVGIPTSLPAPVHRSESAGAYPCIIP